MQSYRWRELQGYVEPHSVTCRHRARNQLVKLGHCLEAPMFPDDIRYRTVRERV